MKYVESCIALTVVALLAPAAIASKASFRVYNNSGYSMTQLRISESSSSSWGPNILNGRLPNDANVRILFHNPSSRVWLYDFRAVFSNGNVEEDFRVNVCRNNWVRYR